VSWRIIPTWDVADRDSFAYIALLSININKWFPGALAPKNGDLEMRAGDEFKP
jgi:hypothetical protein